VITAPERSLALRVPIGAGEALDSWLEFLARRNGVSIRRLLPVLGLPTGALPERHSLVRDTPAAVLRRMERQSGLPAHRLDDATLERYQAIGWPALHGSRYCPRCLAGNGGRWLIRWRLPWVFACRQHQLLLADRCPACHRPPRHHIAGGAGLHPPSTCPNRIARDELCGADLASTAARPLAAADRLSLTQRWIDTQLNAVETAAAAVGAATALADLHAIADWSRSRCREGDYRPFGPAAVHAFARYRAQRADGHPPARSAFTDSLLIGAVATRALDLLTADTDDAIATHLCQLLGQPTTTTTARRQRRALRLGPGKRWTTLSSPQQSRVLHAVDSHLAPLDRLRYRSATSNPRPPEDSTAVTERARHIPQLLWPEWTVRLLPAHGFDGDALRAALSTCLLLPGRRERTFAEIAAELHPHRRCLASTTLSHLLEQGYQDVLVAICRLADYLDQYGSPIDYRRRRKQITSELLSPLQWQHLCRIAVVHPGQQRRYLDAHRYLFGLLTGADLNDPCHTLAFRSPADRSKHITFTTTLSSPLRGALHQHATDHLQQLGLDEPLAWTPPDDACAGLSLPGRDPHDIDLDRVRALVIDQHQTPASAARELNTTIEHIRLALERVPRQRPRDIKAAPAGWQREQQARVLLTNDFFEREYITGQKRLRNIQADTGFCRRTLARYAKHAGIALAVATEKKHIDQAWLADQYLQQRRSFVDIAAELGISDKTVTAAARDYGIPARPAGITSHPDLITKIDNSIPADVRRAVEGQLHGWQRLRRFEQVMAYTSLNTAGPHIGAHLSALISQLRRLEDDVGGQLFHRATPTTPMRLTQRGAALLHALRRPDIQALLEQHGRPPRGKRHTDEKNATDTPMRTAARAPAPTGPDRQVR